MKITIDIPKEFEKHFEKDRFKESLERIYFDVKEDAVLSGRYELETLEMLKNVLGKAEVASKEKWIPCSLEMPEEDKDVLISYRYKDDDRDTFIDITDYGWVYSYGVKGSKELRSPFPYFNENCEIVAWMPLPEPYRG